MVSPDLCQQDLDPLLHSGIVAVTEIWELVALLAGSR